MRSPSNSSRSRSISRRKIKQGQKQQQRDRQKKRQTNKLRSDSYDRSPSRKKKKNKDKHKSRKKKSRSRERSREKKHKTKNYKSRSRQRQDKKQTIGVKKEAKQDVIIPDPKEESPKRNMTQEERQKKFAMRQVRARLLKLNGLFGKEDDSEQEQKPVTQQYQPEVSIPRQPQVVVQKKLPGKRESKWGKTSSTEPNVIPIANSESIQQQALVSKENQQKSLSIDIEASEDKLGLSEDKSIEVEEHHSSNLSKIDEQQIDPLDMYMNQIQGQAVPQMDLPKKGYKGNVVSFEDIVTQQNNTIETNYQQKDDQKFKEQFLKAVKNIDQVKSNQQNKKGQVMEHNEEKQSDFSDYQQQEEELDFFAKQRKMAERKELNQIDHSKIKYEEVTFNIYRQAEQIKAMDPKAILKYRKQAGDIKIRGKGILNPILNWYHCGFSEAILSTIEKNEYQKPFPIQAQSIPMILSGRDVIGIAETGSGKTLAYLLPMIKHITHQRPVEDGQGPIGIVMTPTRQLANQVFIQAKKFCKSTRIRVLAVYGGLQIQKQLSDFRKGAQIVVCTPGRMIDILTLNKGKVTNLKRVSMIVIDEADRMFDLGFQPQITRIIDNVRPHRQSVLFSATFPKNVQNLARRILTNPVQILIGSRGQACRNVQQIIEVRDESSKFLRLLQILGVWNQKGSILIFIDKQNEADYLYQELAKYGYHCLVLHGAMDPTDRQFTIYDFKKGIKTIMISTSVCARGLDIKEIRLVVNFKCPNHLEDYIHRIGRTGRAGIKGTAITFITPQEQQHSIELLKALEMSEIHPPQQLIKMSQQHLKKVKKGEARKIRNRNIQGAGFKFDKEEQEKTTQLKDMIRKQLKNQGLGDFDDSSDEDISMKKRKQEEMRGRNQQERVVEAIKNPQIKNKLLNQAVKAVSQAIKNGSQMTTQKLLEVAVTSMKQSVTKHKVITTVDDGVEQVTKLINEFTKKGTDGLDFFSYDFEINDYPLSARQRACNQNFLSQVQRDNNCSISLRGTYVEPGKKCPVGNRKLYLNIQSEDKSYVSNAYKDIKRVIEESAYENMHMSSMGKYAI